MLVKKRVEEELEKRKDEIEQEVARRVEAAKIQMEREMMIELEKRREAAREEERKREVNIFNKINFYAKFTDKTKTANKNQIKYLVSTIKKHKTTTDYYFNLEFFHHLFWYFFSL